MKDDMSWQLTGLLTAMILVLLGVMADPLFSQVLPWMTNTQTLSAETANQFGPSIAWNSHDGEYLVVWTEDYDAGSTTMIRGIRVDAEGLPTGSAFTISGTSSVDHRDSALVAYDPGTNRYLVTWMYGEFSENDDGVWGRLVPAGGPSSELQEYRIAAFTDPQTPASWDIGLAADPISSRFLVVWLDNGGNVSARFVEADGTGDSSVFVIAEGTGAFTSVKAAWNHSRTEFLVAYSYSSTGDYMDTDGLGRRLSSTGTLLGSEIVIANGAQEEWIHDVASCRGTYLVLVDVFDHSGSGTYSLDVTAVSGEGMVGGTSVIDVSSDWFPGATLAADEGAAEYLITWSTLLSGTGWSSYGIYGAFFNADGAGEGVWSIYSTPDDYDFRSPAVAYGTSGKALCAWSYETPSPYSFDIRGRLVGNRIFGDGFESGDGSFW